MDRVDLKLDWCDAKAARFAVERWHYSRRVPVSKVVRLGVWEDGAFIGVVMFGCGTSAPLASGYGLKQQEVAELTRVALTSHHSPVSRIIAIAVRKLRRQSPGLRLLVSFADPSQGHHGGIYQAANWVYTGMSSPTKEYRFNGGWRHVTDVYKRLTRDHIRQLPVRIRQGKHRYLMPLDGAMRNQIEPLRKPYPKRAGSADGGTSGTQLGGGGSNPTSALSTDQTTRSDTNEVACEVSDSGVFDGI